MHDAAAQRVLRKQALLLRAATERAEMVDGLDALRQSAGRFSKTPGWAVGRSLPLVLGLLRRAPLLSPLVSLAWAGVRRPAIRYGMLAAGASWLLWKGWQGLAARKPSTAAADDAGEGNAADDQGANPPTQVATE